MRIIFVFFFTICILVKMVACLDNISVNDEQMKKYTLDNSTEFNRKSNPDIDLSTDKLIKKYGYPSEIHVVITDDGYFLTLHRIPGKFGSHPILLQHGLLASSADWVISGPKKCLAYLLADEGYDVWLGNFRGNTYSKAHKSLSTEDPKFWNFSWHEMGIYDLPAMISYITTLKQSNLTYIGHSMGTTTFYVMSIMRQDIANKVQMMFSLAPVIYMTHMKSPIRFLAPFSRDFQFLARFLGQNEFLPHNNLIKFLAKYGCDMTSIETTICRNIMFLLAGFDESQMNATLLPVILGHAPAGSSTKTVVHYLQEVNSGKFRQFDYGTSENLKIYNSIEPPDYNISKISVPIALYYAENDWFVNIKDLLQIPMELKNIVDMYKIPYEKFNHIDFMWAIKAPELVYSRILNTLKDRA